MQRPGAFARTLLARECGILWHELASAGSADPAPRRPGVSERPPPFLPSFSKVIQRASWSNSRPTCAQNRSSDARPAACQRRRLPQSPAAPARPRRAIRPDSLWYRAHPVSGQPQALDRPGPTGGSARGNIAQQGVGYSHRTRRAAGRSAAQLTCRRCRPLKKGAVLPARAQRQPAPRAASSAFASSGSPAIMSCAAAMRSGSGDPACA